MNSLNKATLLLLGFLFLGYLAAPMLTANQRTEVTGPKKLVIVADGTDEAGTESSTMDEESKDEPAKASKKKSKGKTLEVANFGAGCFWCVEAVFDELKGVHSVESGFMGGFVKNPSYEDACSGKTGHAEIAQIKFDPSVITFKELLEVFWKTHDPTTLNRQGHDVGTQYRSAVFYTTSEQKELTEKYKKRLNESGAFAQPIVTEIAEASDFYTAGPKHKDYFQKNPSSGYCQAVIRPKVDKFRKAFSDKLKTSK